VRFHARQIGLGVWGIFDTDVMGWRATDLSEDEAHQKAANFNLMFNQYGQRSEEDRLEVQPPIEVEVALWSAAGQLVTGSKRKRGWGRVRGQDGHQTWIRASNLRRSSVFNQ
jgi:hypothetical protein